MMGISELYVMCCDLVANSFGISRKEIQVHIFQAGLFRNSNYVTYTPCVQATSKRLIYNI